MAVHNAMFLFEVVVEKVNNFVESRCLVIKSDFADVFSLELRDPKTMHIAIPEPPPLPPEPPGKKGKKKAKPKPKKGKKGKKGAVEEPPPEPAIQSGQSVLFTSNAEFLTQAMRKYPLELSLWSKEEHMVFIGSCSIPWDPAFLTYLAKIYNCEEPPPVTIKDDYNVFQEGSSKIMAKLTLQVKLSYLTDRIVSSFRTLSEDPTVRKCLYTGMNSKTTSYICTLKTTDEEFAANCNKVDNQYIKSRPPPSEMKPLIYADYTNKPGAKLPLPGDGEVCCIGKADKQPDDKYKAPETCPDIDFICDYVRKIINSCNDNMRMLTPRPTIRPRIKATDIDRLCYCRETSWPQGQLAERFRKEAQSTPCPVCIRNTEGMVRGKQKGKDNTKLFDIANIRGPCGKPDCKIARDMRSYLENLLDEDNKEVTLNEIIGPCGSKSCTLVDKIKDFLRHKGAFSHGGTTVQGLSTQCACLDQMQNALVRKGSCDSVCSHDCEGSESTSCGGPVCPYRKKDKKENQSGGSTSTEPQKVFNVYYFTVEYDNAKSPPSGSPSSKPASSQGSQLASQAASAPTSRPASPPTSRPTSGNQSPMSTNPTTRTKSTPQTTASSGNTTASRKPSSERKFRFCEKLCPMNVDPKQDCSKDVCPNPGARRTQSMRDIKCVNPECPTKEPKDRTPSPKDSDLVISFKDIHNPCCVKSCSVAERVKDFIAEGVAKKSKPKSCMDDAVDPCYCDCDCTFKFSARTTYCAVCGGYECLGDDVRALPDYTKPHPCPVYHKLYNRKYLRTESPWPHENVVADEEIPDNVSTKTGKSQQTSKGAPQANKGGPQHAVPKTPVSDKKDETVSAATTKELTKTKKKKKAAGVRHSEDSSAIEKAKKRRNYHEKCHFNFNSVPKNMGWLWTSESIPGMKVRPNWKPGCAHKMLVRKYKALREGQDVILKKKRALLSKKKKIEMKPTLVVKKLDGEYTVQMEVFKKYSKERMLHQYPYDEKPPLIYTIGKTDDTKYKIQRQRERRERRETRRKSRLLQSTFRDKCQEICLKAYNQAIGLLPLPNPNNPDCPCDVQAIKPPSPVIDSCSCSQSDSISSSDTDGDDWVIEFTPPLAKWDAKAKHLPVPVDNECQYNHLDFRVKLLDKQGNPVPRFFKGPDGNQECSDLGGFWGPNHVWLEINKDGYIGPDNRWVPINFTGPDGMFYLSEEGFFTDHTGATWKIGIDGYIDKDGKWAWYAKKKNSKSMSMITADTKKSSPKSGTKDDIRSPVHKPPAKGTTKTDDHKTTTQHAPAHKPPEKQRRASLQPHKKDAKGATVMNVALMSRDKWQEQPNMNDQLPVDSSRIARYNEIMQGLHDNFEEYRLPFKTNRASNTPLKMMSPVQSKTVRNYGKTFYTRTASSIKRSVFN